MSMLNRVYFYADRLKRAYKYAKESKLLIDPVDTPLGFKFQGHKEMEQGVFEPDETKLVMKLFNSADVFINIGANIGYYSCFAISKKIHTVIFEPIQSNLNFLYKNIYANNFNGTYEIFPVALSNKTGLIEMYGSGTGASLIKGWDNTPEYYVSLVPVSTADAVLGPRFESKQCFILIDVEGVEKYVMEGASILLNAPKKPVWMLEIATKEHQPTGVTVNPDLLSTFEIFWKCGYEAWTASNVIRLIEREEIERVFEGGENTLPGNNNFLFIEKGRKENFLPNS